MRMNYLSVSLVIVFGHFIALSSCEIDCTQPPSLKNTWNCCTFPELNQALAERCGREHGVHNMSKPVEQQNIAVLSCFFECIHKEKGYLVDGNLALDRIRDGEDFTKKMDETAQKIYTDAVESCVKIATDKMSRDTLKTDQLALKCSPLSLLFIDCLTKRVFMNCPNSLWKKSDECGVQREFIRKCFVPKN